MSQAKLCGQSFEWNVLISFSLLLDCFSAIPNQVCEKLAKHPSFHRLGLLPFYGLAGRDCFSSLQCEIKEMQSSVRVDNFDNDSLRSA